ncbi:MAG: hypothetical protein LC127_14400 [Chitinophagales bacterium]|nr:hypothetical protein [Chitinophagales bacterium]
MTIERLNKLTDILPVLGGAGGAASQINNITPYLPTMEAVTSTIIITVVGAVIGYLVKLAMDRLFKCNKNK